jgi:hypothetical protein
MIVEETPVPSTGGNEESPGDSGTQNQPGTTDANPVTEPSSSSESDAKSGSESLSDIVSKALEDKGESSTSERPDDQKSKEAGKADPKAEKAEGEGEVEGKDEIPQEFHKHPAWQRLKKERDEARSSVDQYRQDSEDFGAITGFMGEHNIAPEEVAETLHWLAMRNADPVGFGMKIVELANQFQESMGLILPKELQDRVEAGELTEEDAKAIARSKAEATLYKNRSEQQLTQERSQRDMQSRKALGQQMANTVNNWEKQIQTRDPDYQAKRRLVQSEIRAYIQQYGMPRDTAGALKYAETAYKAVTEHLAGVLPQRKPNNPAPTGGKTVETIFAPKSLEDVVSHALTGGS